jgi:hypothetical protein
MSARFESGTIGTVSLDSTSDGRYAGIITAPLEKLNYPTFSGTIQVYYKNEVKDQKNILVNSESIRNDQYSITKEGKEIDFYVNSSLKRESDTVKLFDSNVYCKIYKNGTYVDTINFDILETQAYTEFKRSYNLTESGNYSFNVYLEDGFSEGTYHLFDDSYGYDDGLNSDPDPDPDQPQEDDPPKDPDDTDDPDGNEDNGETDDSGTGDDNEGDNDDDDNNSQGDSTQKEEYFIHLPSLLIPMMTVSSVLFLTTSIYRKRNEKHLT